jgi:hydroxypyruvate reductase
MSVEIAAIGVQRPFVLEALEQEFVLHKVWEAPDRAAALRPVAASVRGAIANAMSGRSADMIEALPNLD